MMLFPISRAFRNTPWLFALLALLFFTAGCRKEKQISLSPEVIHVKDHEATIAWQSPEPSPGRVLYQAVGAGEEARKAQEGPEKTYAHEVVLQGLKPATRYTYWLEGSEDRFQFMTQPGPSTPFSFVAAYGKALEKVGLLVAEEMPDFLLVSERTDSPGKDPLALVRPYLPVFSFYPHPGPDSPFLASMEDQNKGPVDKSFLDWGGLRLVFSPKGEIPPQSFDSPKAHTFGLIAGPGAAALVKNPDSLENVPLHRALVSHNRENPGQPVAFVLIAGDLSQSIKKDGIVYFGLPGLGTEAGGYARVDVDVDSARAVFPGIGKEIVLREPPLKKNITCAECRRLADKGSYEESVAAYQAFIANNKGHFQVDDALYAIGEILDEKLFRFNQAIIWYKKLVDQYPSSSLAPLARQRLRYLAKYSDNDFAPLEAFEKIRKRDYGRAGQDRQKAAVLEDKVEGLIYQYPDSALAPVMRYWLANQVRANQPNRAIGIYREIIRRHPGHDTAQDAWLEIGETLYQEGKYGDARNAYENALSALPDRKETIKAQIDRCKRNILRKRLAWAGWGLHLLIFLAAMLKSPLGPVPGGRIRYPAAFFLLWGSLLLGAWVIREQFANTAEMFLLCGGFSQAAVLGAWFGACLAKKTARYRVAVFSLGSLAGLAYFLAGVYLTLYYVNTHYLIIFKL